MPQNLLRYLDFKSKLDQRETKYLPLFHVCSQDNLVDYLENQKIVESEICDVFDSRVIYTFYGASKFKSGKTLKNESVGDRSVCLILNIEFCSDISCIYPLDTGIASGKLTGARPYIIPWEVIKAKLNLGKEKDRINKMILHCFEDMERYIDGIPTVMNKGVVAKYRAPVVVSSLDDMHKIIMDQSVGDDRRLFVEVHFKEELNLRPNLLQGVIVAADVLDDTSFVELLEKYRLDGTVGESSLFYPSALEVNETIEETMKRLSIDFSKKIFLGTYGQV